MKWRQSTTAPGWLRCSALWVIGLGALCPGAGSLLGAAGPSEPAVKSVAAPVPGTNAAAVPLADVAAQAEAAFASLHAVAGGFGLQNVINNFVSGLILLFERPIKVAMWSNWPATKGW